MPGGSELESQLFKLTPPVFRGACIRLPNGHTFGESRRQGLLLSWRGSWVLPQPQGPRRLQVDLSEEPFCLVYEFFCIRNAQRCCH